MPVRVAIVGLGFGAEFIPIYQAHPDAQMYAICRRNRQELDACGNRFGIKTRYTDFNELLRTPTSMRSTSIAPSPTTPRSRWRRSRRASTSPARCRWAPRPRSASNWSRRSAKAARST